MNKTKIAFFFGAGAEGEKNYNIGTGYGFLTASLFGEGIGNYSKALSKYFSKTYFGKKYKYSQNVLTPSSLMIKNIIVEKIRHAPTDIASFSAEIAGLLNKEDIDELKKECENDELAESELLIENIRTIKEGGKGIEDEEREREFRDIIQNGKDYDSISDELLKKLFKKNDKGKCDIDVRISIAGFMDSYFHTIIDPPKYSKIRFSKIFNYYWACYFVVMRDVLKLFPSLQSEYFDGSTIDCLKILKEQHLLTSRLYEAKIPEKESYYKAIAEYLSGKGEDVKLEGVLTTNYFHFAEKVLEGNLNRGVAYLNGQLKWMEKPELLEVFDLDSIEPGEDLYFPFIFGQSLTKPLVHVKQIEEFHKAKEILDRTDCLIVLGYGINEDDNHVNSLLHEFLKKEGKRILVITNDKNADYAKRLKIQEAKVEKRVYDYRSTTARAIINEVLDSLY